MHPFTLQKAKNADFAINAASNDASMAFVAGGTDLLGLMKDRAVLPGHLLDINDLPGMRDVQVLPDGGLRIGALARMSDVAANIEVRRRFPVIAQGLLLAASGQLRNMASIGGNILQRTRCAYFRDGDDVLPCNKRRPGSGCSAVQGLNRGHAIFGWSEECLATHPSDLAVALAAMEAVVRVQNDQGERKIAFPDFHRLPGDTPERDHNLAQGDLIVGIDVPAAAEGERSYYLKLRDRQSYEFALVSVAAGISMKDGRIQAARLALGGVAHRPWRLPRAEAGLRGLVLDDAPRLRTAIATSFNDARPLAHNSFKIDLAQRAVLRAVQTAGAEA